MSESISVSCSKMDDGTVIRRSKSSCRKLRDTSRPHGAWDAPRPATSETFADDHKGMKPYRRPSVAAGRQEVEQPAERCSRSSELAQSLSQCPHFAYLIPQPPTRGDRVGGVAAMLVVAVARPLGSPGSLRATVHPAAPSSSHGRRLAWLSDRVLAPHRAACRRCCGSWVGCMGSSVISRPSPPGRSASPN